MKTGYPRHARHIDFGPLYLAGIALASWLLFCTASLHTI